MSDEDTDQGIFTERNTGSTRDLRDCIMGFRKLNWERMRFSARNAPLL